MSELQHGTDTGSVLARLKQKRRATADSQTTDMPVPGYGGELVVRYKLLDPLVEGKEIGDRIQEQFKGKDDDAARVYFALVDALIASCVAIYAKVEDELVPLAGEGSLTTFEDTTDLAELLGFEEEPTARATVAAVFAGNRIAVAGHAQRLQLWMADTSGELNQGLFR